MAINYSPELVTDGAVFVGDARDTSTATAGSRLYNQAGVDSANVKLLIHGNEGSGQSFTDSSLSNHTITTGGQITHSTTQSKFSGGSIYCDGSYDFLKIESSSVWVFDGDFTVDLWIYPQNSGTAGNLVGDYYIGSVSTSPDWQFIYHGPDQKMNFWRGTSLATSSNGSVLRNQWTHVALVRSGSGSNNCKIYINGTLDGQGTFTTDVGRGLNLWVGIDGNEISEAYLGYMDEIRITKGVALWDKNFTPPARRDTLVISDGMMYNGSCLNFDGSDDWVDCGSSPITSNSAFSWAAWINPTGSSGTPFFLGTTVAGEAMVSYWDSSTGMVRLGVWGADRLYSTIAIPVNSWGHTCWTWDGTTLRAYTNGVAAGTATPAAFNIASNDMIIGAAAASAQEFEGNIADVKLYNVALSASQVKELYQDSKVIIPSNVLQTNLKGWWPLVDGAGDYAYDGSGNGNDGTLTNMTSADWLTGQTGCPQLVEGYNKPMLFDADGYVDFGVDIGGSPKLTLDALTDYTFSWWSRHTSQNNPDLFTSGGSSTGAFNLNWAGSTNRPILYLAGSNYAYFSDNAAQDDGQWHHWLLTYNGTATSGREAIDSKLYIDGVNQGITSAAYTAAPSTWGTFRIGRAGSGGTFSGDLNEFIIYNGQLGSSDRAALYVRGPNGGPLPPDPMSLSNSSDILAYWRNDGNVSWKNRGPQVIKNFTDVATDPLNDTNSVGSWTHNGTSLTSVTGGRTGFIDGAMRVAPRYRFLFDSAMNMTVNSIIPVTSGKTYKVSAWFKGGTSTTARLIAVGYYDSGNFSAPSTVWTNKTSTFKATSTANMTLQLHNRAAGTMFFDDVTLVESGPALDGTVSGSPDALLFKQGYNGSASTSTGRDGQGFPLLNKDVGAMGGNATTTYTEVPVASGGALDITGDITLSAWVFANSKSDWDRIFARRSTGSSALPFMLGLNGDADQTWDFYLDGSSGITQLAGTVPVALHTWYNVVGILRGTSMELYVNGELDNSKTHTGGIDAGGVDPNLQIGAQLRPSYSAYSWDGQIANALIYNRALSVAELKQNYNAQRSRFE